MTRWVSPDGAMELRLGDWRDVLADVESCDAVITDPPYSDRTHTGQRTGSRPRGGGGRKSTIAYRPTSEQGAADLVTWATSSARWWVVVFSDHRARGWYEPAIERCGWYSFAPVVWVKDNPPPRLSGDGPTSSCEYITVGRPRNPVRGDRAGSRPGHYVTGGSLAGMFAVSGGKPLGLMRALVRDYSRPGDLIVDPCAGGGTTLLAAAMEGRRALGAEIDPDTYAKAVERLRGLGTHDPQGQRNLFGGGA